MCVSASRGISRRALIVKTLCGRLPTRSNDHTTFPAGLGIVTFVGRSYPLDEALQHFARLRRWGLTFSASFSHSIPHTFLTPLISLFPHYLEGHITRRPFPLLASRMRVKNHAYKWHIRYILPVIPRYSPNAPSRTSSHFTRTSGRATPTGPAPPTWMLEHVGFDKSALLSSSRSSALCGWRNS